MTPAEVAQHGNAGHVMTTHAGEIVCVTCTVKDRFRLFMMRPVQINDHVIVPWAIIPGSPEDFSPAELRLYDELMVEIMAEELAPAVAQEIAVETIRVLAIPCDESRPVTVQTIERTFVAFRDLVGGGWLEVTAPIDNAWTLWVDEDGISKNLPFNARATRFAHATGWGAPADYQILGPSFFTGPADPNGDTLAVPEYLIATAAEFFKGDIFTEVRPG